MLKLLPPEPMLTSLRELINSVASAELRRSALNSASCLRFSSTNCWFSSLSRFNSASVSRFSAVATEDGAAAAACSVEAVLLELSVTSRPFAEDRLEPTVLFFLLDAFLGLSIRHAGTHHNNKYMQFSAAKKWDIKLIETA